jgi:hypothetical protein
LFEPLSERTDLDDYRGVLKTLAEAGNPPAKLLQKVLASEGQTFMEVTADALRRPADQDVVTAILNIVGRYFMAARITCESPRDPAAAEALAAALLSEPSEPIQRLLKACPELRSEIEALLFLAHVNEALVTPVFARSDAVGSVMRAKIEPIVKSILARFAILQTARR